MKIDSCDHRDDKDLFPVTFSIFSFIESSEKKVPKVHKVPDSSQPVETKGKKVEVAPLNCVDHRDHREKQIKKQIVTAVQQKIALGYRCPCGSISYLPRAFRWKDTTGKRHPGFSCMGCSTRYWFI